jgi:hypothetical protein
VTKFAIESAIFCEFVRPEVNGKYTLLGASAPFLKIQELPGTIMVSLFLVGTPDSIGDFKVQFRATDPAEKILVSGEVGGQFQGLESTSFAFGPFPLNIEQPGQHLFEWCFADGKWDAVAALTISI